MHVAWSLGWDIDGSAGGMRVADLACSFCAPRAIAKKKNPGEGKRASLVGGAARGWERWQKSRHPHTHKVAQLSSTRCAYVRHFWPSFHLDYHPVQLSYEFFANKHGNMPAIVSSISSAKLLLSSSAPIIIIGITRHCVTYILSSSSTESSSSIVLGIIDGLLSCCAKILLLPLFKLYICMRRHIWLLSKEIIRVHFVTPSPALFSFSFQRSFL